MFCKILAVLGLVIFGLSGCKPALADRIVTQAGFQSALDLCRGLHPYSNPAQCLLDTYEPITKRHCSEDKLSPEECSKLDLAVLQTMNKYMAADQEKHTRLSNTINSR
jgi:hypothetical protein